MKIYRKVIWVLVCVFLFGLMHDGVWAGKSIRIRLGTIAIKESLLHEVIKEIKQEWQKITNNEVEVTIYAGGVLGDEPQMVEDVRGEALQAVALSSVGLSRIDNSIACLQIPMMFRSYAELDYVRDRLGTRLEKKLEERGFKLLHWADVGWVHTFAKKPAHTPDELKKLVLFTQAGDAVTEKLYNDLGFRVEPLSLNDMPMSLQSGMVEALNLPPLYALSTAAYRKAPNMIGVKWMPLVAGTVIDLRVWKKIPDKYRPQMLEAARKIADRRRAEIRKKDEDSIREMKKRKLNVVELDERALAVWQREAEKAYPKLRGKYAPADLFDEVQRLVNEFRKSQKQDIAEKQET